MGAVDGGWSFWQAWTTCSSSCGNGTYERRRFCNNPAPQLGGLGCQGPDSDVKTCVLVGCPGKSTGPINRRVDGRTDGQTDGRTDGRAERRTDEQRDERTDGRTKGRTDGRTKGRTDEQRDERTDGQRDGRTDGQRDGRTDRETNGRMFVCLLGQLYIVQSTMKE